MHGGPAVVRAVLDALQASLSGDVLADGLASLAPCACRSAVLAQERELACNLGSTGAYHLPLSSGATSSRQALGLRPAEAGEFSRRAFDAGKLDLTQAGRGHAVGDESA